jgi:hypothetical protein
MRLPFVRPPFADELLTSWLERVACVYGRPWDDLFWEINVENLSPIRDYRGTPKQFNLLSQITSTDVDVIKGLDLARKFPGHPITRFQCHPDTKVAAPDFCYECFHDDVVAGKDNYVRHEWAIAGVSHCHIHKKTLRSSCIFCGRDFSWLMRVTNARVQVYCKFCGEAINKSHGIWGDREYVLQDAILDLEVDIICSLKKPGKKARFKILEDIAFLYFCADLPRSAAQCKEAIRGWKDDPRRAISLTRPLSESWRFDGSQLWPLLSVVANYRLSLTAACIAILRGMADVQVPALRINSHEASIQGLFKTLDHAGREELVSRANSWPKYLRKQVKEIVNAPRNDSLYSVYSTRTPWISSDARLAINRGEMPKYLHF